MLAVRSDELPKGPGLLLEFSALEVEFHDAD
jgi:hypothetical protein